MSFTLKGHSNLLVTFVTILLIQNYRSDHWRSMENQSPEIRCSHFFRNFQKFSEYFAKVSHMKRSLSSIFSQNLKSKSLERFSQRFAAETIRDRPEWSSTFSIEDVPLDSKGTGKCLFWSKAQCQNRYKTLWGSSMDILHQSSQEKTAHKRFLGSVVDPDNRIARLAWAVYLHVNWVIVRERPSQESELKWFIKRAQKSFSFKMENLARFFSLLNSIR